MRRKNVSSRVADAVADTDNSVIDEKDARGPRERVYDEDIHPMVCQLIDACQECGIPIVIGLELDMDENSQQTICVSMSNDGGGERSSGTIEKAAEMMIPGVTK